jgi:hypothetical protein
METQLTAETLCFFTKLGNGPSPKKKVVSVNLSRAIFCLLDFSTPEDGTNKMFHNVGAELPLYTALCLTRAHISHDDLAMQALV